MTILKNSTGSKQVEIHNDGGTLHAMYVQNFAGESGQVLESRSFQSIKGAERWAGKKLA